MASTYNAFCTCLGWFGHVSPLLNVFLVFSLGLGPFFIVPGGSYTDDVNWFFSSRNVILSERERESEREGWQRERESLKDAQAQAPQTRDSFAASPFPVAAIPMM